MSTKLYKSKWYIANLDNRCVAVDHAYDRFWEAMSAECVRHRMTRYTAMTGAHILAHEGRPWIIPLTPEEAEELRDGGGR